MKVKFGWFEFEKHNRKKYLYSISNVRAFIESNNWFWLVQTANAMLKFRSSPFWFIPVKTNLFDSRWERWIHTLLFETLHGLIRFDVRWQHDRNSGEICGFSLASILSDIQSHSIYDSSWLLQYTVVPVRNWSKEGAGKLLLELLCKPSTNMFQWRTMFLKLANTLRFHVHFFPFFLYQCCLERHLFILARIVCRQDPIQMLLHAIPALFDSGQLHPALTLRQHGKCLSWRTFF